MMKGRHLEQAGRVLIMKGYTRLRHFCGLQVNFNYRHCPVAHFGAPNDRSWPYSDLASPRALAVMPTPASPATTFRIGFYMMDGI
jgi:hypothetical protein